ILEDLAAHPGSTPGDVRRRIQRPHNTVDRELRALQCIDLVVCNEEPRLDSTGRQTGTVWRYNLPAEIDPHTTIPEIYVPPQPQQGECTSTYISGNDDVMLNGSTPDSRKAELIAKGKAIFESGKYSLPLKTPA